MGSFNTACAITGTPIIPGQKVKLFVIIQNGSYKGPMIGGSLCYPWDLYNIVGLPMNAEYADYNNYRFLESEQWVVDGNLKLIQDKYVMNVVEEGKTIDDYNKYHDHMNIDKESLDWEKVEDMIHSDRLFMRNWRGKAIVHLMAIPVEVYDVLMQGSFEIWGDKVILNGLQEFLDHKLGKFHDKMKDLENMIGSFRKDLTERLGQTITPPNRAPYILTQEMIEESVSMYTSRFALRDLGDRMEWMDDIYAIRDIFGITEDVMKRMYEVQFLAGQFMIYNQVIRPAMLSGQEWDFKGQGEYLIKLGHAVQNMSYDGEEGFPIQKITKVDISYELKLSELERNAKEWFTDHDKIDAEIAAIKADAGDKDVFEILIDYRSEAPYMGLLYDNLNCMHNKVLKILMKG